MSTDLKTPSVILNYSNDNWEHNPANPRQWPPAKKWQAMAIVRNLLLICIESDNACSQVSLYSWLAILGTTLMNPALLEIAIKYGTVDFAGSVGLI